MYLLFYSKKCKYSIKFVELLHNINEDKFFEFVEVKKVNGKFDKRIGQYGVKEVPTVIIDSQLLVGQQAFNWLKSKIKNINHSVSTLNTRANKTPVITGYAANISSASLSETQQFDGNNMFSSINNFQKINTPDMDQEYEKTPFILPSDNITDGNTVQDTKPDKVSRIDLDMEKLLEERKLDFGVSRRF
jgi:glutaredoxin